MILAIFHSVGIMFVFIILLNSLVRKETVK